MKNKFVFIIISPLGVVLYRSWLSWDSRIEARHEAIKHIGNYYSPDCKYHIEERA